MSRDEIKPVMRGIMFDVHFLQKGIIKEVRADYGADGVLFVQEVLFALAREPGAKLKKSVLYTVHPHLDRQHCESIINLLIERHSPWLFVDKFGLVFSDRILAEQQRFHAQCRINKENIRVRWDRNRKTKRIPTEVRNGYDSTDNDNDSDNDPKKKSASKEPDLIFPASINNPRCHAAWAEWLEFKKSKNQRYKNILSQQKMLNRWKNSSPEKFVAAIDYSMAQNYSGLFEEKTPFVNGLSQNQAAPKKPTPYNPKDLAKATTPRTPEEQAKVKAIIAESLAKVGIIKSLP